MVGFADARGHRLLEFACGALTRAKKKGRQCLCWEAGQSRPEHWLISPKSQRPKGGNSGEQIWSRTALTFLPSTTTWPLRCAAPAPRKTAQRAPCGPCCCRRQERRSGRPPASGPPTCERRRGSTHSRRGRSSPPIGLPHVGVVESLRQESSAIGRSGVAASGACNRPTPGTCSREGPTNPRERSRSLRSTSTRDCRSPAATCLPVLLAVGAGQGRWWHRARAASGTKN